jgi:hypothetical protein
MCKIIDHEQLLELARVYAGHRGISLRYASVEILSDNKRLNAIEAGADIGIRRLRRAWLWLDEHWPEGADWPAGIPRPVREDA